MSLPEKDNLKQSENFLNYIPYTKLTDLNKKDYLKTFLVYIANKHSILPEMAEVLSPEQLFNFLFVFSGQLLIIPDQKAIIEAFRDLDIFNSLVTSSNYSEIQRLADKYQLTTQTIKAIVNRVSEVLQKDSPLK